MKHRLEVLVLLALFLVTAACSLYSSPEVERFSATTDADAMAAAVTWSEVCLTDWPSLPLEPQALLAGDYGPADPANPDKLEVYDSIWTNARTSPPRGGLANSSVVLTIQQRGQRQVRLSSVNVPGDFTTAKPIVCVRLVEDVGHDLTHTDSTNVAFVDWKRPSGGNAHKLVIEYTDSVTPTRTPSVVSSFSVDANNKMSWTMSTMSGLVGVYLGDTMYAMLTKESGTLPPSPEQWAMLQPTGNVFTLWDVNVDTSGNFVKVGSAIHTTSSSPVARGAPYTLTISPEARVDWSSPPAIAPGAGLWIFARRHPACGRVFAQQGARASDSAIFGHIPKAPEPGAWFVPGETTLYMYEVVGNTPVQLVARATAPPLSTAGPVTGVAVLDVWWSEMCVSDWLPSVPLDPQPLLPGDYTLRTNGITINKAVWNSTLTSPPRDGLGATQSVALTIQPREGRRVTLSLPSLPSVTPISSFKPRVCVLAKVGTPSGLVMHNTSNPVVDFVTWTTPTPVASDLVVDCGLPASPSRMSTLTTLNALQDGTLEWSLSGMAGLVGVYLNQTTLYAVLTTPSGTLPPSPEQWAMLRTTNQFSAYDIVVDASGQYQQAGLLTTITAVQPASPPYTLTISPDGRVDWSGTAGGVFRIFTHRHPACNHLFAISGGTGTSQIPDSWYVPGQTTLYMYKYTDGHPAQPVARATAPARPIDNGSGSGQDNGSGSGQGDGGSGQDNGSGSGQDNDGSGQDNGSGSGQDNGSGSGQSDTDAQPSAAPPPRAGTGRRRQRSNRLGIVAAIVIALLAAVWAVLMAANVR